MSDPDLSATPQSPHWLLREPGLPPPLVQPHREDERVGGVRPAKRTQTASRIPPTTLSGYEQILATRAALLIAMGHTVSKPRVVAGPLSRALPIKSDLELLPQRVWPRRLALAFSGLLAPPVVVLLALAWWEPLRSPDASVAEPETLAWAPALPSRIVEAAPTVANGEEPILATRHRDTLSRAATLDPGMPLEEGEPPPSMPNHAEVEAVFPPAITAAAPQDIDAAADTRTRVAEPISEVAEADAPPASSVTVDARATEPSADPEGASAPEIAEAPLDQNSPSPADTDFASLNRGSLEVAPAAVALAAAEALPETPEPVRPTVAPAPPPAAHVTSGSGVIMALSANVRSGPDGIAPVLRTVSTGARLRVFARVGGWLQVGDAQPWGWVHASRIEGQPGPEPVPAEAAVLPATNVRSGPDGIAPVLRTVSTGARLRVFARVGGWLQVGDAQPWGWVHASRIEGQPGQ